MGIRDKTDPHNGRQTYYGAVVNNPLWQEWEKVAYDYGFDYWESVECGWLSDAHFAAFLKWVIQCNSEIHGRDTGKGIT